MNKKLISIFILVIMLLSMVGCGSNKSQEKETSTA
jgi:predicted small lipoprotein YifL